MIEDLSELIVDIRHNAMYVKHRCVSSKIFRKRGEYGHIGDKSNYKCIKCGKALSPKIQFILSLRNFHLKSK